MQCPAGEMAGHIRKRFLLYPDFEIANFQQEDRDNSNAHSVYMYIMFEGQLMLYPYSLYIFQCENIVFSFILVRRLAMPEIDEQDKSHTFFLWFCLIADFWDL